MLPSVFLSLSGVEERFVAGVHKLLPDGIGHFYPVSFANGENLLEAMETRVGQISVFVFFASKASTSSVWVNFELDRARISSIKRSDFRILVFPVDKEITYRDIPIWMQEYWTERAGLRATDIARYIRNVCESMALAGLKTSVTYGRGALLDRMIIDFQEAGLIAGSNPNVFIFAGNDGIGRRTACSEFLAKTHPSLPDLDYGPEYNLPHYADIADLYRAVRQDIEPEFSIEKFQPSLAAFQTLPLADQAAELALSLAEFSELHQAVKFITGYGLYDEQGSVKSWVRYLFLVLNDNKNIKTVFITNRLISFGELRAFPNIVQFLVPELDDAYIRSLIIAYAEDRGQPVQLPKASVITSIGGHAQIAKATARLIDQQGVGVLNEDQRELFALQEEILARCLDFAHLTNVEKDVLSILSWVPFIASDSLRDCLLHRLSIEPVLYAETLANLQLACLIQVSGPNYKIAPPMRFLFRRKHGYGSLELRSAFASTLRSELNTANEEGRVHGDLIDAILYMSALEGSSFPTEFRSLILPSTLHEIMRDIYDRRYENERASLMQVIQWGTAVENMAMDDTVREEILSLVVRAQSRLGDKVGAEHNLATIDAKMFRSRFYLRAFHLRKTGGDLRIAVDLLQKAKEAGRYRRAVIVDLGLCLYKLGRFDDLRKLIALESKEAAGNPAFIDLQVALYIGEGDYRRADEAIRKLRSERDDGRADSRAAMIMMLRDQDFKGAQKLLTDVLQRGTKGSSPIRRLRAFAAAHAGDFSVARSDMEWFRGQPAGADTVHTIEARILLQQRSYPSALTELSKIQTPNKQDKLLRARILDAQASDPSTSLALRQDIKSEAAVLRRQNGGISEFEGV